MFTPKAPEVVKLRNEIATAKQNFRSLRASVSKQGFKPGTPGYKIIKQWAIDQEISAHKKSKRLIEATR